MHMSPGISFSLIIVIMMIGFFIWQNFIIKQIRILKQKHAKDISVLQKQVEKESNLRKEYYNRTIEIENAVKEGTGISLRNDVTQVVCIFDEIELAQIAEGVTYLIQQNCSNISDVEFLVNLTKKINGALKARIGSDIEKGA
jgi:hypothetical protein